jgi:hypothetical protein
VTKKPFQLTSANITLSPRSLVTQNCLEFGLAQTNGGLRLAVLASPESPALNDLAGERSDPGEQTLLLGAPSPHNAAALHDHLA